MTHHEAPQGVEAAYNQLCQSYRAIDDMRTKLLGALPLSTGAGILFLSGGGQKIPENPGIALAVGLFGVSATLGLFSYELHGIKKCAALIDAGQLLEKCLGVYGQFLRRPQEFIGFMDEPFAASVIYPASLAGWFFFAFLGVPGPGYSPEAANGPGFPWMAACVAGAVFVAGLAVSISLIRKMERDMKSRRQYSSEPYLLRAYGPGKPDRRKLPDTALYPPKAPSDD